MPQSRRDVRDPALRADYAHCLRIARHAENFPVASRLLPGKLRPHLAAIYAYARGADDLADEPSPRLGDQAVAPDAEARLAALDAWEAGLEGAPPAGTEPVFRALAHSRSECALPDESLRALLQAFRYDVRNQGYGTWDDLLGYAKNSAASVGRLVLAVAGARDAALLAASDDLCVALQLTNFWQDLSRDMPRGRLTLPEATWRGGTLDRARLLGLTGTPGERWKKLKEAERLRLSYSLEEAVGRTEELFEKSHSLPTRAGAPLRTYLGAVWQGGYTVLERVRELGELAFVERPSLTWGDRAMIALRAALPAALPRA